MNLLDSLMQLLQATQHARLLRLSFPHGDAPSGLLVVNRLSGTEAVSRDYRFTLQLLSDNASLVLDDLIGKLLCVSLVKADGRLRPFTGHVAEFKRVRTDGGVAFYEAVIVPWFQYLEQRRNSRLFHDKSAQSQMEEICGDYRGLARFDWTLSLAPEVEFTMATQWDETDRNYIARRLEAEGRVRWYEHTDEGHTLVVRADTLSVLPIDPLRPDIRFHAAGGSADEDAIAEWSPTRRWTSASAAVSAFDFKHPRPVHGDRPSAIRAGKLPRLESHTYEGHYGLRPAFATRDAAELRIREIEGHAVRFEASGNCSRVAPGRWFELTDHFGHRGDDAEFLVLEVHHEASNNYLQDVDTPAAYANRFTCQPRSVPWHPPVGFDSVPSRINAPQTALVVGPESFGSMNVDEFGRVQVQFHWNRRDDRSCWLRVATAWAGGENGLASHPRVGSEVVVQWLDGNPDHPIVTGGVHNGRRMPPWRLPHQRALTGIRSRELAGNGGNGPGGRSNHLVLDDTGGQIQAQLRSDHLASQLSLGHITRIEDNAGRRDARGQGFELRTDGRGTLRGGAGLLISTECRPDALGHITDMVETVERLAQARDLHDSLSGDAQKAGAHLSGDQDEVVASLTRQADDIKGSGASSVDAARGRFPEFRAPHLTLASPAGIESTTQGSTHHASVGHHAVTSGGHVSISTSRSLLASAKQAVRLFALKAGIKLAAAAGDIDITALKNGLHLLAKLDITLTADTIKLQADREVLIVGGGSFARFDASGITHGTAGTWIEKAASHHAVGPDNLPGPSLPKAVTHEELVQKQGLAFTLRSHAEGGRLFAHEPYTLSRDGAVFQTGVTDARGRLIIEKHEPGTARYAVALSNGHVIELPVQARLDGEDDEDAARGHRG